MTEKLQPFVDLKIFIGIPIHKKIIQPPSFFIYPLAIEENNDKDRTKVRIRRNNHCWMARENQ